MVSNRLLWATTLFVLSIAVISIAGATAPWVGKVLAIADVVLILWWVVALWGWQILAWLCSRPVVFRLIVARAMKTPYSHIVNPANPDDFYMRRFWLFNAYSEDHGKQAAGSDVDNRPFKNLPSIRVHHIMRPDLERDPHNHPWDCARTVVMQGHYTEVRMDGPRVGHMFNRCAGDTATLNHGMFHRILNVSEGGVWTMFLVWKKASSWGFQGPEGDVVPWRTYLGKE